LRSAILSVLSAYFQVLDAYWKRTLFLPRGLGQDQASIVRGRVRVDDVGRHAAVERMHTLLG
jgi:hypothetical protein